MVDETVVMNTAKKIFGEMGVDWEPVEVENDKLHGRWILSVHIESAKKPVEFYINKGPLPKVEESMRRHVRHRMEKLDSN